MYKAIDASVHVQYMFKRVHCTQVLDSEQTQKPLPDSGERLGNGGAN